MLMAALTISAQSVVGRWLGAPQDEGSGDDISIGMVLNDDNTGAMLICSPQVENIDEGVSMVLDFCVEVECSWQVDGNTLTIVYNIDSANLQYSIDFEGVDDATKGVLMPMATSSIEQQKDSILEDMKSSLPTEPDVYTISQLTDTELIIVDDEGQVTAFQSISD